MRYPSCPALGKIPIALKAHHDDMAPESWFPGRPLAPGMKVLRDGAPDSVRSLVMSASPNAQIRDEESGLKVFPNPRAKSRT